MNILELTFADFEKQINARYGRGSFHASAAYKHFYRTGRTDFSALPEFQASPGLARAMETDLVPEAGKVCEQRREDDVIKFVTRFSDGLEIESVIIPMTGRTTLCVSCQVGCRMGCRFCETGRMGLIRNLTAAEIVGQVIAARNELGRDIRNVVFMGMGEAFDNFDAVIQAVRVMNDPRGLNIAYRYITLSTAGLIDGIEKLAALHPFRPNLGVSLNASSDALRSKLMPINEKHSMQRLRAGLMAFPLKKYEKIMITYVLIEGYNNQPAHARELAEYLAPIRAEVNVIAYNPVSERDFLPPDEAAVERFCELLASEGVIARKRPARGRTILGACGQLGNRHLTGC